MRTQRAGPGHGCGGRAAVAWLIPGAGSISSPGPLRHHSGFLRSSCHDTSPNHVLRFPATYGARYGSQLAGPWRNDHQGWRVVRHRRKLRGGAMIDNRTQVFDVATKTARGVGVFTAYAFAVCALLGSTVSGELTAPAPYLSWCKTSTLPPPRGLPLAVPPTTSKPPLLTMVPIAVPKPSLTSRFRFVARLARDPVISSLPT